MKVVGTEKMVCCPGDNISGIVHNMSLFQILYARKRRLFQNDVMIFLTKS